MGEQPQLRGCLGLVIDGAADNLSSLQHKKQLSQPIKEVSFMPYRTTRWLIAGVFALAMAPGFAETKSPPKVFGWVEEGQIQPENISVKIKLDTGALTSSMDAKDLERFEKDNERWVRFNVEVKDNMTGKMTNSSFERKVVRNVKVRGAGGAERRPVVMMKICIGSRMYDEEFSLKDRGPC